MKKLRMFYDYECPFCKRGHEYLMAEAGGHPDIEIEWRPIEAHPLPEDCHPHTNLACQSFYIASELGADLAAFHAAMYQAIAIERRDVEKPEVLCGILKGIVDAGKLRAALDSLKYAKQVDENNELAYERSGVWYVPAFRMDGRKLDSRGGAGINQAELRKFLSGKL